MTDRSEKRFDLFARKSCSRLIHDQDFCIEGKGTGHLHHLLHCYTKSSCQLSGINAYIQAVEYLPGIPVQFFLIDHARPQNRFPAQENIFCHCEVRVQNKLLVDDANTQFLCMARTCNFNALSFNFDFTFILFIGPAHDLHQCGFSGTIFTQKYMHFPSLQIKVHILQCHYARELLTDMFHFQYHFRNHLCPAINLLFTLSYSLRVATKSHLWLFRMPSACPLPRHMSGSAEYKFTRKGNALLQKLSLSFNNKLIFACGGCRHGVTAPRPFCIGQSHNVSRSKRTHLRIIGTYIVCSAVQCRFSPGRISALRLTRSEEHTSELQSRGQL